LLDDAEIALVAYGSTARPAKAAAAMARKKGIRAGLLKLMTLWPFPGEEVKKISEKARTIMVPELNLGQIVGEVERRACGNSKVVGINRVDGALLTPEEILAHLEEGK
jgi:2-oxoglutarate ferredoxin oxidoreductase subunit alpha